MSKHLWASDYIPIWYALDKLSDWALSAFGSSSWLNDVYVIEGYR